MIKAVGQVKDGVPLVVLGLSSENFTRLLANEPIAIDMAEMGLPPMQVLIVGRKTEREIAEHLEDIGLFPPGTAAQLPDPQPGTVFHRRIRE